MRLIDADAMKEELLWGNVYLSDNETNALVDLIDNQPTIDLKSLRPRAHWLYDGRTDEDGNLVCRCSRCEHGDRHSPGITVPYCWFCGAKMEVLKDE